MSKRDLVEKAAWSAAVVGVMGFLVLAPAPVARAQGASASLWVYRSFLPPNPSPNPNLLIVHWAGPVVGPVYNGGFVFNGQLTTGGTILGGNWGFSVVNHKGKLIGFLSGVSRVVNATDNSLIINPLGCTGAFVGATGRGILRCKFINANLTAGRCIIILPLPQGPPPLRFRF
jgi:hypothetical protein